MNVAGRALSASTFIPRRQAYRYHHNKQDRSGAHRPHPIPLQLFWRAPVRLDDTNVTASLVLAAALPTSKGDLCTLTASVELFEISEKAADLFARPLIPTPKSRRNSSPTAPQQILNLSFYPSSNTTSSDPFASMAFVCSKNGKGDASYLNKSRAPDIATDTSASERPDC